MQPSRLIAGSLLALSATGCLATKGDIRLLQDELRATRASVARSDSVHRRTSDSLAQAVTRLAAAQSSGDRALQQSQQRSADSLRALSARVTSNDINTKEQIKAIGDDLDQLREITRQNARSSALARAQMEQASRPGTTTPPDSTGGVAAQPPVPAGTPGPATLLVSGRSLIVQGSCTTARRSFQDVLTNYPESIEAAEAQYYVAESYLNCGDASAASQQKADSVYRIVADKYPTSDYAAISLYKRAEMQRTAGKADVAKSLYTTIVCKYPKSTVYPQALDRLGSRPVCR